MSELRPNHLIFLFLVGVVLLSCFLEKFGMILRLPGPWHVAPIRRSTSSSSPTAHRAKAPHRSAIASRLLPARSRASLSRAKFLKELQKIPGLAQDPPPCDGDPQLNVVFIKTHKTGSTTLSHIINRFGFTHELSFAVNKKHSHNGHLGYTPITRDSPREMFLPPIGVSRYAYRSFQYNIMTVHVRYDRAAMDSFMIPPTHYVTVLRDPGYQFESAFSHFQFDDAFLSQDRNKYTSPTSRLAHFLERPDFYRERLKHLSWEEEKGLRWYYAKNNQMYDLGLDHDYHGDKEIVDAYIQKLQAELDLVLITEYYDESLLLLKTQLCWDTADVLYVAKNMRPPSAPIPEYLRDKMRRWNSVDMQLYAHFNQSLWGKIEQYGPTFRSDLTRFRAELQQVFDACVGDLKISSQGRFKYSNYKVKAGSGVNCTLIVESKSALFRTIWDLQAHRNDIPEY